MTINSMRPINRPEVAFWALFALAATGLFLVKSDRLTIGGFVFAIGILAVCAHPLWSFIWEADKEHRLPFAPAVMFFYFVAFAVHPFLIDFIWPNGSAIHSYVSSPRITSFDTALMGAIFTGVALMHIGLVTSNPILVRQLPILYFNPSLPITETKAIAALCLILHFAGLIFPAVKNTPSLGQLSGPLGFLGFGIFFTLLLDGKLNRVTGILVFALLLPWRVSLGMSSGALVATLSVLALFLFLLAAKHRRLFFALLVMFTLIVATSYGPFVTYRAAISIVPSQERSLLTHVRILQESLSSAASSELVWRDNGDYVVQTHQGTPTLLLKQVARRINQTAIFATVFEQSPDSVPFWQGESLKPLLTAPVPRFLWPNKPPEAIGNVFGHRYGLIDESDTEMAVNLPWLVETYANFGWAGLVFLMGGAGLALSVLDALINRSVNLFQNAASATVLFPLINHESNISLTLGNTISLLVFIVVLARLVGLAGRMLRQARSERA